MATHKMKNITNTMITTQEDLIPYLTHPNGMNKLREYMDTLTEREQDTIIELLYERWGI